MLLAAASFAQTTNPASSATAQSESAAAGPDNSLAAAAHLVDQRKYDEAEAGIRAFLRDHDDSAKAHFLLGLTLFLEHKPKESLAEYTAGAKYETPSAGNLKVVGLDYVLVNDYADAGKWLRESVALNPLDAEAWYSLGRVEYTLNRFEASRQAFLKTLTLDPHMVKAQDNLGLALDGLNRPDDAIAAWHKAIDMQAGAEHPSEQPYLNLGTELVERNQAQDALQLLQKAEAIAPSDAKIQEQLGKAYIQLDHLDLAAQHLEGAVALKPNDPHLHFQLGQVYRKLGLADKAKTEFARTEALNGTKSNNP